jgi:hypothetical protein
VYLFVSQSITMSYFETITSENDIDFFNDYRPDSEYVLPEARRQFSNKINTWLYTENGNAAKAILNTVESYLKKYKFNDKYQLKEDIIYLLYKYQNKT